MWAQAKVLVFLSTCKQVKYVYEVLRRLRPGVPLRCIHGKMKQMKRMAALVDFTEVGAELLCTYAFFTASESSCPCKSTMNNERSLLMYITATERS